MEQAATIGDPMALSVAGEPVAANGASGCHGGKAAMREAASAAGKSAILDQCAKDYPQGPHDQPQSMCPAFGSLRVGLRMKRTATVLSGSACCVYGLTFTAHFYGARRSVGYVPFNSETLVTGKLFEDIREAVHKLADPALYDAIVVTNLCVPTASGVPLRLLPDAINGVRIIGIDVPGFGIPTHAEAKDVLAGAMLAYARKEASAGPVMAPAKGRSERPSVALLGEMFPADPVGIGALLDPLGLERRPGRADPGVARALRRAGLPCRRRDPPVLHRVHPRVRERRGARSSAPARSAWTAPLPGSTRSAARRAWRRPRSTRPRTVSFPPSPARWRPSPFAGGSPCRAMRAPSFWSPACSSRAGLTSATSAPPARARRWSEPDREWLDARGIPVTYRASLEQDLAAMRAFEPDLAIGTTPLVQQAKALGIPALYFTNLISARPLFGMMGAGSLAEVVNAAIASKPRFDAMRDFFEGVGAGHAAGVWQEQPVDRPDFREKYARALAIKAKQRAADEKAIGETV